MPSTQLSLATTQSHISADVRENGRCIRELMRAARRAGADLIHFLEGALSGYVKRQVFDWAQVDWAALDEELEHTASLANELNLWVVLGANHKLALQQPVCHLGYGACSRKGMTKGGAPTLR